jgi:acyl dehydratase
VVGHAGHARLIDAAPCYDGAMEPQAFTEAIGQRGGAARIVVERSAIAALARALHDPNPIYVDADAARAAGFRDVPAPPTFLSVAPFWGVFAELQPEGSTPSPTVAVLDGYARQGGLTMHGEQGYEYRRPIVAGDVLDYDVEVVDSYVKGNITFTVSITRFTDAATGELVAIARNNFLNRV